MPKIMHINCACTGSTGKIIGDIAEHTAPKGYETFLCVPCAPGNNQNIEYFRTSLPYEQGVYRRLNYFYGFQYGFAPLSTVRIKGIIKKEKPDIVHIHCVNSFMLNVYSLLRFLKARHIPTVITNHAEFFYTGSCAHAYECEGWKTGCGNCPQGSTATMCKICDTSAAAWKKMQKAFRGFEDVVMVSVSPWVKERAESSPITAELPQKTVLNGVNTNVFCYRDPLRLREKYGFAKDQKIIFHPTANFSVSENDCKGGRCVLELAEKCKDVVFIVAGKHQEDIEAPPNMVLLGQISDQQRLAEYYALSDITVIAGKRETFGMPVAESLCCGTPVAGFWAGGPESVAIEKYSRFCAYGDVSALADNVQTILNENFNKDEISACAREKYAASRMAKEYMQVYEKLLTKGRQ